MLKKENKIKSNYQTHCIVDRRITKIVCIFLSCHVRVSEWIYTLQWPECQGTPCSKQARNLKFKWLQVDSNPEPLSS